MNGRVTRVLHGVAVSATLFATVANAQSHRVDVIDLQKIPGAPSLGWVDVERRIDDIGWHCDDAPTHQYDLLRLREGHARIPPDVSGFSAIFEYELRHGGLPEVDPESWNSALDKYFLERLTMYVQRGKPGSATPTRPFPWRDWLRRTLEKINAKANREGMSQGAKSQALRTWVLCHISEVEAERIRQLIYDTTAHNGEK